MSGRAKINVAQFLAESHIAGREFNDAIETGFLARQAGWNITLGFWRGPFDSPVDVSTEYLILLDAIAQKKMPCRISIKPAAIHFRYDLMEQIIGSARLRSIPLMLDAEHPNEAERTMKMLEWSYALYHQIGCTIPARWERSASDLIRASNLGADIRIVKGQWINSSENGGSIRQKFLQLIGMVHSGRSSVSVATHDTSLLDAALDTLTASGVLCESEQMFGLPWIAARSELQFPASRRMYIPYGFPYLPYNLSFAAERPVMMYWVLRDWILRREKKMGLLAMAAKPVHSRSAATGVIKK